MTETDVDFATLQSQCYELWAQRNPHASRLVELWPGCCPLDLLYGCASVGHRDRVQEMVNRMILGGQS